MKWEELTAGDFAKAVRRARNVCVLPVGCIEKHGDHLPLGTDLLDVRSIAEDAVGLAPAVLFPSYYFSQIQCAKHQPGTIALRERLLYDVLENVCEEIARNGLTKILLLNGHGGNRAFLHYFAWMMTYQAPREFTVYLARLEDYWQADKTPQFEKLMESAFDEHGGEKETSLFLTTRADLVRQRAVPRKGTTSLGRVAHLPLFVPIHWYADFPDHYAGDARAASAAKGKVLRRELVRTVATLIEAVKADTVAPRLVREFHRQTRHHARGNARP